MSIRNLRPSSARLLLAAFTRQATDSFDDVVKTSGISKYETYVKAKEQLQALGFCREEDDGLVIFLRSDLLKEKRKA